MEVSIWWVVAASFIGVWLGFFLFAALTIARGSEQDEQGLAPSANVHTLV